MESGTRCASASSRVSTSAWCSTRRSTDSTSTVPAWPCWSNGRWKSEVSGVGCSLNPVTNDYDEAVIDASFGLGETVVSGEVSPDHFVVDKPGQEHPGATPRQQEASLAGSGRRAGSSCARRREAPRPRSATSRSSSLQRCARSTSRGCTGYPVDIEWAYAGGELHLLQARPITTYFPLSDRHADGARRPIAGSTWT